MQQFGTASSATGLIRAIDTATTPDALSCRLTHSQWTQLASYLSPQTIPGGQMLIRQGEGDRTLYLIESGTLAVSVEDPDGRLRLAVVGAGSIVGEGGFLSGQPRMASVVSTSAARLWSLSLARFQELSARQPQLALELLMGCGAVVVRRLAGVNSRLAVT